MPQFPSRDRFAQGSTGDRRRRNWPAAAVLVLALALVGAFLPRFEPSNAAGAEAGGGAEANLDADASASADHVVDDADHDVTAAASGDGETGRDAYLGPQTTVDPPRLGTVLRKSEEGEPQEEGEKAGEVTTYPFARRSTGISAAPNAAGQEFQPAIRWGGRTVAVSLRPGTPATAIVAGESGGLFRTTNTGSSWSHLDGLAQSRMFDVAYAPTNANVVLAVTNWDTHTTYQGGIWRSTNGGTTWSRPSSQSLPCNTRGMVWSVAFSPTTSDAWVGTDCGVQISHDLGATWTAVSLPTQVFSVVASSGSLVDICSSDGHRRSTTGGLTWSAVHAIGFGCHGYSPHAIAVSPWSSSVLFAMSSASEAYESRNAGGSWTKLSTPAANARPPWLAAVRSADGVTNHIDLYVGNGVSSYRRTCTGTAPICAGAFTGLTVDHADQSAIAVPPGTSCPTLMTSDGGVHGTADCGATWTMRGTSSNGLAALQLYEHTNQVHPDHTDYYFGTQDNELWASPNGGSTWTTSICCEGFFLQAPHSSAADTGQVITGMACSGCFNFRTAAHFAGFAGWNNPPSATGLGGNPFLVSPGVYVQWEVTGSTVALYRSTNTGANWTRVPGVTTNLIRADRLFVTGPASAPILYQPVIRANGTRGVLKITGALGASGTVASADAGLVNIDSFCAGQGAFLCPTSFGVDPRDPNHLIASDIGARVMKQSRDGGATWTPDTALTASVTRSGSFLLDGQVRSIAVDPTNSSRVLVGTEATGVSLSQNAGRSWYRIPGTEAIPSISGFSFDEVRGTITASSYGRGLWKLSLPRWGYVYANSPTSASYTPAASWQANSTGASNTITRSAVGTYLVRFPGLTEIGGTVSVTAYGSATAQCKVASWGPSSGAQQVAVRCYNQAGVATDAQFTAVYTKAVGNVGTFGYVWADQPGVASYAPSATYSFNSRGGVNTITRSSAGVYDVALPGLGNPGGTVKVTGYGGTGSYCKVTGWFPSGTVEHVGVRCFTTAGAATDAFFTVTYARSLTLLGLTGRAGSHVWTNQPTTASYPAPVDYSWNSTGGANTVTRSAVGTYQLQLPGLGQNNGNVQVTAYGSGPERCNVGSWGPTGTSQSVNVVCTTAAGAPVDTLFTAQYQR